MTSAVRDASNGARVRRDGARPLRAGRPDAVRRRGGAASRSSARARRRPPTTSTRCVVIDIGGGSTELVVGRRGEVAFHVSTQVGVVRHTERHLHSDPPTAEELDALARDAGPRFEAAVPAGAARRASRSAIAVAGTATQCAAIDLELDPYDPDRVEGHRLDVDTLRAAAAPARVCAIWRSAKSVRGLDPAPGPHHRGRSGHTCVRRSVRSGSTRPGYRSETSSGVSRWTPPNAVAPYSATSQIAKIPTPQMGGYWTFVRLPGAPDAVDTPRVGKGGRASRRRPPTHRPGRCRINRRLPPPGSLNRPLKARTPARPDGANLNPPAPAAGGFSFGAWWVCRPGVVDGVRATHCRPPTPCQERRSATRPSNLFGYGHWRLR